MYSVCACFSPSSFHIDFSDPIQPDINLDEDEDRDEEKKKFLRFHCCIASVFPFRFRLAARLFIVFIYLLMLFFMTHKKNNLSSVHRSDASCALSQSTTWALSLWILRWLWTRYFFTFWVVFFPTVAYAFNSAKKAAVRERAAYIIKCCKMRTLRWGGTDGFGAHSRAVINCSTSSVSHRLSRQSREKNENRLWNLTDAHLNSFLMRCGIFGWNLPHQFVLLDCKKWKKCFISSWDLGAPSWQSFLHARQKREEIVVRQSDDDNDIMQEKKEKRREEF